MYITGVNAGLNYTGAESSNLLILYAGIVRENNVTHIGTSSSQNKSFMSGIKGVTTDVADAIPVLVDFLLDSLVQYSHLLFTKKILNYWIILMLFSNKTS
jgi:hypothetical protein